jgi:Protein of unknown function (DUF3168)
MTETILALRAALRSVMSPTGLILHDETRNTELPYASFGDCTVRLWSDGQRNMAEHRLTIHIWSRSPGDAEALNLAGTMTRTIETAPLPRGALYVVHWGVVGQEMRRPNREGMRNAILKIVALTEHPKE